MCGFVVIDISKCCNISQIFLICVWLCRLLIFFFFNFSLDASLQRLMVLWQKLHVDMKSLLSWQYYMRDILLINSWNFIMVTSTDIPF